MTSLISPWTNKEIEQPDIQPIKFLTPEYTIADPLYSWVFQHLNKLSSNKEVAELFINGYEYALAGGAIRSFYDSMPEPRDFDFYCFDETAFNETSQNIKNRYKRTERSYDEEYAHLPGDWFGDFRMGVFKYPYRHIHYISLDKFKIQLFLIKYVPDFIYRLTSTYNPLPKLDDKDFDRHLNLVTSITELVSTFDFACCKSGIVMECEEKKAFSGACFKQMKFITSHSEPTFWQSVSRKELIVSYERYCQLGGISFKRFYKYTVTYGYKVMDQKAFSHLASATSNLYKTGFTSFSEVYDD